jgi:type IV pilus assembly protein PilW
MQAIRPRRVQGVTLIELMVGMTIGLLTVLIVAQVAIVYEGQKRNTTSGADAQINGALALQTLQREIQASGFGMASGGAAGCTVNGRRGSTVPPWNATPMVPVRIVDGTAVNRGSPDTLLIMRSNTQGATLPIRVTENHTRDAVIFVVDPHVNFGNTAGDLMMVVPPLPAPGSAFDRPCSVFNISATPSGTNIAHAVDATTGPWNHDTTDPLFPGLTSTSVAYPGSQLGAASQLINLGTLTYREYSLALPANADGSLRPVSSGSDLQLRSVDSDTADWAGAERLYTDIVNLQAVYGHDQSTAAPGPYRNADTWDTTDPTSPDGWNRVIAVRIAIVARSSHYEKDVVTTIQPSWMPDGVTATPLGVDHLSDWQHYRYKVFETVIPLRNMLWQS